MGMSRGNLPRGSRSSPAHPRPRAALGPDPPGPPGGTPGTLAAPAVPAAVGPPEAPAPAVPAPPGPLPQGRAAGPGSVSSEGGFFNFYKWLYPGMRVKRWFFLVILGTLV